MILDVSGADALRKTIRCIACLSKGVCRWGIIAVVSLALAACGGNNKEIDDLDIIIDLEPVDIHIYTKGFGSDAVPRTWEADEVENMLLEVEQVLSDSIKVTPVFHWIHYEKFYDEVVKLVKSGERVDAFISNGGYGFHDRDVLMDLSSFFPQYAPNYYNELMSHNTGLQKLKNSIVDDKLVCIPANDILTQRAFIVARKDLAEQFAPDGFETLEDYGEFMALVKEHYPSIVPGNVSNNVSFFSTYIQGNGYFRYQSAYIYMNFDPSFRYESYPMERLEEFASAYNLLKEWHEKEYIRNEGIVTYQLSIGEIASALMNGLDIGYGYLNDMVSEHKFVVDPLYTKTPHEAHVNSEGLSVSRSCTCPDRVMMLLEWMHSSQEAYDLFMYGIENKNYVLDGDRVAFVSEEHDITPIINTHSARYFKDYRYDRLYEYQPDNFKEVYRDACLVDVMTTEEISEKVLGITPEDEDKFYRNEEAMEKYMEEYANLQSDLEKYEINWKNIMDRIGQGDFTDEPSDIMEMQWETGIDGFIDLSERLLREIRGE